MSAKWPLIPLSGVWTTMATALVALWLMEVQHVSVTLDMLVTSVILLALLVE